MIFEFTASNNELAQKEIAKYPSEQKQSAVMALLTIAQKQNNNYLAKEAIEYVAKYLDMPVIKVLEVASFYSMYNLKPIGKYHVQVCGNVVCHLRSADTINKRLEQLAEVANSKSKEQLFTVSKVECLGACANAPVVQINDKYYEDITLENIEYIIKELSENKEPKHVNVVKAPAHLQQENNKNGEV
ncbi:complex I 24 kDa subunit family protein [Rickettsiales bacterium LUAb2]